MLTSSKIIETGTLQTSSDSWLLICSNKLLLVDIPFSPEMSLDNQTVTILGTMGVPPGSTFEKLIAEKIVSHESIAKKAYEIYLGNTAASAQENWFHAENELLEA